MLKKKLENYIANNLIDNKIELPEVVTEYVRKHNLVSEEVTVVDSAIQFDVIELCNKETEELIRTEEVNFLNESISYLDKNREEFIYLESKSFELARIDAIVLELDDVFETYTALFGLKLQKKFGADFKAFLDLNLTGDGVKYSVIFSDADGLWDVNLALNYVDGFNEDLTFIKVADLIYRFVYNLVEAVEDAQ